MAVSIAQAHAGEMIADDAQTLPAEDRKVLLYRGLEGLPHLEVARRTGSSVQTVQKRWQRLRSWLKDVLPPAELLGLG